MTKWIPSTEYLLGYARDLSRYISLFLFMAAISMSSFAYRWIAVEYKLFPYDIVSSGVKTFRTMRDAAKMKEPDKFVKFADMHPKNASPNRIQFLSHRSLGGSVLWYGGPFEFLDYCPDHGCIAVVYTADGEPAHVYPYRPDEIERAWTAYGASDKFPFEFSPSFSFTKDVLPTGMTRYPNGDLLVIFSNRNTFPYMGGVARIDRDEHIKWFRRDYSHHWPQLDADDNAMLPSMLLPNEPVSLRFPGHVATLECPPCKPYHSAISFIDEHGHLFKSLNVMKPLLDSPFAAILQYTTRPYDGRQRMCDIIHLNFVHRLGDDAGEVGVWLRETL